MLALGSLGPSYRHAQFKRHVQSVRARKIMDGVLTLRNQFRDTLQARITLKANRNFRNKPDRCDRYDVSQAFTSELIIVRQIEEDCMRVNLLLCHFYGILLSNIWT